MSNRALYAIHQGWRYKSFLANCIKDQSYQTPSILSLQPNNLIQEGIKVLVLDFDGVLASHAENYLDSKVGQWLNIACKSYSKGNIFILSNKPSVKRAEYFASNFPEVEFVRAIKKKPFPDGLLLILKRTKVLPKEILLVDDRLATGALAAAIAGTKVKLVLNPYKNFSKRPIRESFFEILRFFERRLFWLLDY